MQGYVDGPSERVQGVELMEGWNMLGWTDKGG